MTCSTFVSEFGINFKAFPLNIQNCNLYHKRIFVFGPRAYKFKLRIPLVGVDVPKSSFTAKACRMWNNLSEKLCVSPNIDTFKSQLKNLLFKLYQEGE